MNKRHLYPKNWLKLRVMILIRDGFCCTICGIHESKITDRKGKQRSLHVMHLDGNTFNNKYTLTGEVFNNPLNNLASGCPFCHYIYDLHHNKPPVFSKKENHQIIDMNMKPIQ